MVSVTDTKTRRYVYHEWRQRNHTLQILLTNHWNSCYFFYYSTSEPSLIDFNPLERFLPREKQWESMEMEMDEVEGRRPTVGLTRGGLACKAFPARTISDLHTVVTVHDAAATAAAPEGRGYFRESPVNRTAIPSYVPHVITCRPPRTRTRTRRNNGWNISYLLTFDPFPSRSDLQEDSVN